jgi:hypothetical protein
MLREFYIYKMPMWSLKLDYSVNINPIAMKLLPLDSFQYSDSNEPKIIEIQSLDSEIVIF